MTLGGCPPSRAEVGTVAHHRERTRGEEHGSDHPTSALLTRLPQMGVNTAGIVVATSAERLDWLILHLAFFWGGGELGHEA